MPTGCLIGHSVVMATLNHDLDPELPPRSEYSLSDLGTSLIPIIDSLMAWGEEHKEVFKKKYSKE